MRKKMVWEMKEEGELEFLALCFLCSGSSVRCSFCTPLSLAVSAVFVEEFSGYCTISTKWTASTSCVFFLLYLFKFGSFLLFVPFANLVHPLFCWSDWSLGSVCLGLGPFSVLFFFFCFCL